MTNNQTFPKYIVDSPSGSDFFEGQSQVKLAGNICGYIKSIDIKTTNEEGESMPRIIGLEGGWGTGKSNVVKLIDKELSKQAYYTFIYDAWGHQEDLQRRSILETLTKDLIDKGILHGKVSIRMRNGKPNPDNWENQLSMLLSNKTTTIRKSIPVLTTAGLWGIVVFIVFTFCTLVSEQLINSVEEFKNFWWIDVIPVGIASIIALGYLLKDCNFDGIKHLIDRNNTDTVDVEYTSSEEPSVAEFKNWMKAISDFIGDSKNKRAKKKLIIVFDNMDRLPSKKVMQLWSSFYTFFSDENFENIWAIIPYDFKHLCQAINGRDDDEEGKERIKRFISKTFPITFNVPQPVITDYELLFNKYFESAFGKGLHDQKHIYLLFRCINPEPNPRDVIAFINELVSMRLQWTDETAYRLQNMALFILKKDYILYQEKGKVESRLLSDDLFAKVEAFCPTKETIRTQLCQFTYGIDDAGLASELPLYRTLQRALNEAKPIEEYHNRPGFIAVLENVISDNIDISNIDNAVISLTSLNLAEASESEKESIQSKWDYLANKKVETTYNEHKFDPTLEVLLSHVTKKRAKDLVRHYCESMQGIEVNDGESYYYALSKLDVVLADKWNKIDMSQYLHSIKAAPKQFVEYVLAAKDEYTFYQLKADSSELVEYLYNNALEGHGESAYVTKCLKGDNDYDLTMLHAKIKEKIVKDEIPENFLPFAYINRVLTDDNGILECRISQAKVNTFMQSKVINKQYPTNTIGFEDVLAMYIANNQNIPNCEYEENVWEAVSICIERYIPYTDILKKIGARGSAIGELNAFMILHHKGEVNDLKFAAQNIDKLHNNLQLDYGILFAYFSRFGKIEWGEIDDSNIYAKEIQKYAPQALFDQYKSNPCDFCNSIIELGVAAIEYKPKGFLFNVGNSNFDNYWQNFIQCFIGTKYMPKASAKLTQELIAVLDKILTSNSAQLVNNKFVEKLVNYAEDVTLDQYLRDKMYEILRTKDIGKESFKLFGCLIPRLGANIDSNTASGLISHFIKPVVDNAECASIIVKHQEFYLSVFTIDLKTSHDILKIMEKKDMYVLIRGKIHELLDV